DAPAGRLQQLPRWLTAVPLHYGDIRKVHLAPDAARRPLVIHIQDAHDHYEAQKNIGAMISEMAAKGDVSLIGLEGAHGGFNLKPYRDFPDRGIVGDVADFLLREHFIGGAELAAWTSEKELPLWGVEEPGLYLANIRAFKDSVPVQAGLTGALRGLRVEVEQVKGRLFTPSLQEFGHRQSRYREGSLDLGSYVRYLRGLSKPPAGRFPNLDLFVQVLALEESLDFSLVEKERLDLIKELAGSLSKEQLSALVRKSLLYRSGRLSYGAYYDDLRTLCRNGGVELGRFPRMERYIQYVLAAERIEREVLLSELKGLEDGTLAPLLLTREQRNLQELFDDLSLAQRLSEFKMTPDDWALYDRRRSEIHSMPRRLRSLQEPLGLKDEGAGNSDLTPDLLRPFEDFCRYALRRNQALIDGLLAKMGADGGRAAVLVAGGFHTDGLTALLRRKNVSYVVMTPRIKDIKQGVRSLNFLRERPSLEKLFSGEKITLQTPRTLGALNPTPGYATQAGEHLASSLIGALALSAKDGVLSGEEEARLPLGLKLELVGKRGGAYRVRPTIDGRAYAEVWVDLTPDAREDLKALRRAAGGSALYSGPVGSAHVEITAPARSSWSGRLLSWLKRTGPRVSADALILDANKPLGSAAAWIERGLDATARIVGAEPYDPSLELEVAGQAGVPLRLGFLPHRKAEPRLPRAASSAKDVDAPHPEEEDKLCWLLRERSEEFFGAVRGVDGGSYRLAAPAVVYAAEQVMVVAEDRAAQVFNDTGRLQDFLLFTAARGVRHESWANAQGGGASQGTHFHFHSGRKRSPLWDALDRESVRFKEIRRKGGLTFGDLEGWPARALLYRGKDAADLAEQAAEDLTDLYAANIPPSLNARVLDDGTFELVIGPLRGERVTDTDYLLAPAGAAAPETTVGTSAAEIPGGLAFLYADPRPLNEAQRRRAADRYDAILRETTNWEWTPRWAGSQRATLLAALAARIGALRRKRAAEAGSAAVTGAGGFIGSNLAKALESQGVKTRVLSRDEARLRARGVSSPAVTGDLLDRDAVKSLVGSSDVIYHLASVSDAKAAREDPVEAAASIALGTALVAWQAEQGGKRVVHASSQLVLAAGGVAEGRVNENADLPIFDRPEVAPWLSRLEEDFWDYAQSYMAGDADAEQDPRKFAERYLDKRPIPQLKNHPNPDHLRKHAYGLFKYAAERFVAKTERGVNVRLANNYGPGDATGTKMDMLTRGMLANKDFVGPSALWPDERQYLYVEDLVRLLIKIGSLKSPPKVVNVASARLTRTPRLANLVKRLTGSSSRLEIDQNAPIRPFSLDTTLLETLVGPLDETPLETGVEKTIASLRAERVLTLYPEKDLPRPSPEDDGRTTRHAIGDPIPAEELAAVDVSQARKLDTHVDLKSLLSLLESVQEHGPPELDLPGLLEGVKAGRANLQGAPIQVEIYHQLNPYRDDLTSFSRLENRTLKIYVSGNLERSLSLVDYIARDRYVAALVGIFHEWHENVTLKNRLPHALPRLRHRLTVYDEARVMRIRGGPLLAAGMQGLVSDDLQHKVLSPLTVRELRGMSITDLDGIIGGTEALLQSFEEDFADLARYGRYKTTAITYTEAVKEYAEARRTELADDRGLVYIGRVVNESAAYFSEVVSPSERVSLTQDLMSRPIVVGESFWGFLRLSKRVGFQNWRFLLALGAAGIVSLSIILLTGRATFVAGLAHFSNAVAVMIFVMALGLYILKNKFESLDMGTGGVIVFQGAVQSEVSLWKDLFQHYASVYFTSTRGRTRDKSRAFVGPFFATVVDAEFSQRGRFGGKLSPYWQGSQAFVKESLRGDISTLQYRLEEKAKSEAGWFYNAIGRHMRQPPWTYVYGELLAYAALELLDYDYSKTYRLGALLGEGMSLKDALRQVGWQEEGIFKGKLPAWGARGTPSLREFLAGLDPDVRANVDGFLAQRNIFTLHSLGILLGREPDSLPGVEGTAAEEIVARLREEGRADITELLEQVEESRRPASTLIERFSNALRRSGIFTLEDVLSLDEAELRALEGVGKKSVDTLIQAIRQRHPHWRPEGRRNPLTRWQLWAGLAAAAGLGMAVFGLSWTALVVPAFGVLGVLIHESGHFLAYEALRKLLKSEEPRARFGFQPFRRGVWVETGDLGRGANALVAAAGFLATGFLAAVTGFDASSPISLASMALTVAGIAPMGRGNDISNVVSALTARRAAQADLSPSISRGHIRNAFRLVVAAGVLAVTMTVGATLGLFAAKVGHHPIRAGDAAAVLELSDEELEQYLLENSAVPTASFERLESLPGFVFSPLMRAYVSVAGQMTAADAVEVYATAGQLDIAESAGWEVPSYHIPWQSDVLNLDRILDAPHSRPVQATIHFYDWENYLVATGQTPMQVFERAAARNVTILFENRLAEEVKGDLSPETESVTHSFPGDPPIPVSHMTAADGRQYSAAIISRVEAYRSQWLTTHPGRPLPFGITLNPWAYAAEVYGDDLAAQDPRAVTNEILSFFDATDGLVVRVYLGNSDDWHLRLPGELQRGRIVAGGVYDVGAVVRHIVAQQPQLVEDGKTSFTLESSPQAVVLDTRAGRWVLLGSIIGTLSGFFITGAVFRALTGGIGRKKETPQEMRRAGPGAQSGSEAPVSPRAFKRRASVSTTSLVFLEKGPFARPLFMAPLMIAYYFFMRFTAGGRGLEVYAGRTQIRAARWAGRLGIKVKSYHMAWGEKTYDAIEVLNTSHNAPVDLVVHRYDWDRFVDAHTQAARTDREAAEADLLRLAARNNVRIGLETTIARETIWENFLDWYMTTDKARDRNRSEVDAELQEPAKGKNYLTAVRALKERGEDARAFEEAYADFGRRYMEENVINEARRLRNLWREGNPEAQRGPPVTVIFDTWHVAEEVYHYEIARMLAEGRSLLDVQGYLHERFVELYDSALEDQDGLEVSPVGGLQLSNHPVSLHEGGELLKHGLTGFDKKASIIDNLMFLQHAESRTEGISKTSTFEVSPLHPFYQIWKLFNRMLVPFGSLGLVLVGLGYMSGFAAAIILPIAFVATIIRLGGWGTETGSRRFRFRKGGQDAATLHAIGEPVSAEELAAIDVSRARRLVPNVDLRDLLSLLESVQDQAPPHMELPALIQALRSGSFNDGAGKTYAIEIYSQRSRYGPDLPSFSRVEGNTLKIYLSGRLSLALAPIQFLSDYLDIGHVRRDYVTALIGLIHEGHESITLRNKYFDASAAQRYRIAVYDGAELMQNLVLEGVLPKELRWRALPKEFRRPESAEEPEQRSIAGGIFQTGSSGELPRGGSWIVKVARPGQRGGLIFEALWRGGIFQESPIHQLWAHPNSKKWLALLGFEVENEPAAGRHIVSYPDMAELNGRLEALGLSPDKGNWTFVWHHPEDHGPMDGLTIARYLVKRQIPISSDDIFHFHDMFVHPGYSLFPPDLIGTVQSNLQRFLSEYDRAVEAHDQAAGARAGYNIGRIIGAMDTFSGYLPNAVFSVEYANPRIGLDKIASLIREAAVNLMWEGDAQNDLEFQRTLQGLLHNPQQTTKADALLQRIKENIQAHIQEEGQESERVIGINGRKYIAAFEEELQRTATRLGYRVDAKTKFLLHIGSDLKIGELNGSKTHELFNAVFQHLGVNIVYLPYEIAEGDSGRLGTMLNAFRQSDRFVGFDTGAPFKYAVENALGDVRRTGGREGSGLDFVFKDAAGRVSGGNEDGEAWAGWYEREVGPLRGKRIVVLGGAGPAGSAIAASVLERGAASLRLSDRNRDNAAAVAREFSGAFPDAEIATVAQESDELVQALSEADIVINATGVGKADSSQSPLSDKDHTAINPEAVAVDLNYRPMTNAFLNKSQQRGAAAYNGTGLLIELNALAAARVVRAQGMKLDMTFEQMIEESRGSIADYLGAQGLSSGSLSGENFLTRWQLGAGLAATAALGAGIFGLSWAALVVPAFGALGVLIHESGHFLAYEALRRLLRSKEPRARFGFQPFRRGVWVETGDLGRGANALVAAAGFLATGFLAAATGFDASSPISLASMALTLVGIAPMGRGNDIGQVVRSLAVGHPKRPVSQILRSKTTNLQQIRDIVARSEGPSQVVAITNGGDGEIVRHELTSSAPSLFRADGGAQVFTHEESPQRGQFLGLLDAIRGLRRSSRPLRFEDVPLGVMLPGSGTRMSPLTQRAHGIKPSLPMLVRGGPDQPWMSGAEASLYSWVLVAHHLKRMGFKGMAWKWGDEPQVPVKVLADMSEDFSQVDAVRFGAPVPVTDDLARQKEWLYVNPQTGEFQQVHRRPRAELLARLGHQNPDQEVTAAAHIGSPAFSDVFLEAAEEVFGPTAGVMDVDGYLFEALTHDEATLRADLREDAKFAALLKDHPDFYEKVQELKRRINAKRGREAEAPLNIKVIDFGEGLYWGDIGQLAKARATLWAVNDRYSEEGEFARRLAALENVKPDKFNNIVVGDSLVPQDGSVRNSVIIDTKIYGPSDVDGAVLVDSRLGEARVEQGSVVFGSAVMRLRMGQNAFSYASMKDASEEVDTLDIPRDGVHTSIPADPAEVSRGLEDWRADSTVDVGAKENYTSAKFGNPGSFGEKFKQMRQREVPPADVEQSVNEQFRKPLIDRMETTYFRGKKPKHLAFGTSGLRGLVTDITDLEAYINARGFLDYLLTIPESEGGVRLDPNQNTYISIAGDLRSSTPRIMKAVARAIEDAGFKVENLGLIPTPALTYYAMQKGRASVMVTGSHIPFDRNGIKFNKVNGEVLKSDEAGILRNVAAVRRAEYVRPPKDSLFKDDGLFRRGRAPRLPTVDRQAESAYKQRYLDIFSGNPLRGMNVVVFQHSGVGRDIVVDILKGLGAKVCPAGRSKDFIPIDTENIDEEQMARLQALADQQARKAGVKMDAVISFDGDTDRPLVAGVDEDGKVRFFGGDILGIVVAQHLKADFAAVPISANDAVDQAAQTGLGFTVKKTKIGSPYVIAAMNEARESGNRLGIFQRIVSWEANGGFLTGSDMEVNGKSFKALPTRDAVLPILAALLSAKEAGSLSARFSRLPSRHSRAGMLDNFPTEVSREMIRRFSPQDAAVQEVHFRKNSVLLVDQDERPDERPSDDPAAADLLAKKGELEVFFAPREGEESPLFEGGIVRINYQDGIRIFFRNGDIAHIRPSGNAPQLRIYSNAGSSDRAEKIVLEGRSEPSGILRRLERWVTERAGTKSIRSANLAAQGVLGVYVLSALSLSLTVSVVVSVTTPIYLPLAVMVSVVAVPASGAAGWRRGRFHREQAARLRAAAEAVEGLPGTERESHEGLNARLKKDETHYVDGRRGKQSFTVVHNHRLESAAEARGVSEMAVNPLILSRLSNMEQRSILHHEARHIEFRVNHPRLAGLPFIGSLIEELVVSRRDVIDGDEVYLSFAQDVFALIQGQVEGATKWTPLAHGLDLSVTMKSEDRDQAVREALAVLREDVDLVSARYLLAKLRPALAGKRGNKLLGELGWTAEEAATILRLLQYLVLPNEPIQTDPHFAFYEWYGQILKTLHGTDKPPSQTWPFFSDFPGIGPADVTDTAIVIAGKRALKPMTMRNLVLRTPQVLGPEGADPSNKNQKYIFVKFMDTSDFPPFAHVGFNTEALKQLKRQWVADRRSGAEYNSDIEFLRDFRKHFAELLKRDRELTENLRDLVQVRTEEEFQSFKDAYKAWAIAQAEADWAGEAVMDLSPFTENGRGTEAAQVLEEQKKVRFEIVRLMHKIPFQENQAILIETPTVHAIAGLSLQIHPPDQPKDELWIYKMIYDDKGKPIGALLVEPQRTFDKTDSGADFYTPFAWDSEEGRLGFRKNMTPEFLDGFAAGMDATPRPVDHYLRSTEPMEVPGAVNEGGAGWHRSVDEAGWPYFLVRELRFSAAGRSRTPLEHHSFVEIHATRGEVEIVLKREGQPSRTVTVTPKHPVFLPAGLPYDAIEYASKGPAELLYFARRPAASADTEKQAETKVGSIEMPPAQKERQRRFNEEGAKEWIKKLLARIPGRNPLEDQEALVEANRIDHVYPDLKPGNVRPAKPESIADILGELAEEDLDTIKSFSGGVNGASLYDQIQPRGKRSFWRELFRRSPVEKVIRDRLKGHMVDITLLGGVATRLAKLNKGKPVYFFSLREILTAPIEEFEGEDIQSFLLSLRNRADAKELEGLDLDMPYGRWIFWAYRIEVERLVREANKRTDQWKKRHPVAYALLRIVSFGGWNPYYDPRTAVNNQKYIIHVNQEAGPEIIRDMAREDFFGFNLENIVFLFQDVYNSWEYDPQSGELTRDPEHKRVFGHGQLLYDQVVPGFAFLMERAPDGRYVQKFISQDAMDSMMERGGRMASVEEVGDVNMLVNPLKLGQDVAARVNFDRGYTYIGRVAENLTKQKGGYAVEDEDGRQVILEQYLIEGRDYDHLKGSMLNFWGIRYIMKPVARKLRKSKPFYTLDVRENARKQKRLAIETYMSNLGLLGIGARFRSLSAFLSRTGFPVGIRFKAVFLPGDAGTTFKKPESLENVISAYRRQGEAVDSVRSGPELAQEGAQPAARLEDSLVPNVGVQSVGFEGRYPSLVITQMLEAPSFLKITASAFFDQKESAEQGDLPYDRISAPTFLRTSPYWAEAERNGFFRWAKENPVKARALHEQIQVQLARQNMADPVKWSEREAGLVALAMAMELIDEESIRNGRAQALMDIYNREMRIQEEAAGVGTNDERLAPVSGGAAGEVSRSAGILQRIARLLNLDFNIVHLPVVARAEDGRLA
ncbi:MAG: NAD-dependent epimerase/dehydratase family protein, partial [Elusimicrobiota bacterium]